MSSVQMVVVLVIKDAMPVCLVLVGWNLIALPVDVDKRCWLECVLLIAPMNDVYHVPIFDCEAHISSEESSLLTSCSDRRARHYKNGGKPGSHAPWCLVDEVSESCWKDQQETSSVLAPRVGFVPICIILNISKNREAIMYNTVRTLELNQIYSECYVSFFWKCKTMVSQHRCNCWFRNRTEIWDALNVFRDILAQVPLHLNK